MAKCSVFVSLKYHFFFSLKCTEQRPGCLKHHLFKSREAWNTTEKPPNQTSAHSSATSLRLPFQWKWWWKSFEVSVRNSVTWYQSEKPRGAGLRFHTEVQLTSSGLVSNDTTASASDEKLPPIITGLLTDPEYVCIYLLVKTKADELSVQWQCSHGSWWQSRVHMQRALMRLLALSLCLFPSGLSA